MQPSLSIVIPSVNGWPSLSECLAHLEHQAKRYEIEVIVCDRCLGNAAIQMRERFPWVRLEKRTTTASIPALRWHGMRLARGEFVALIEDHTITPPDWSGNVLQAHGDGHEIVGGPIENDSRESLLDWAFFLVEYAGLMPPMPAGPAAALAGGNVSFRRSLLPLEDDRYASCWEDALLGTLRDRGAQLYLEPRLAVRHRNPLTAREVLQQRFLFSRSIAALRLRRTSPVERFAYAAAAAVALPFLLPLRLARTVFVKGDHRREFILAFPVILALILCGVVGEVAGYLFGDGGSMQAVR